MITYILPTYNRTECMKLVLEESISKYKGDLFQFEIHDSSTTDEVKKLVDKYSHLQNLRYFKYPSSTDMDKKVLQAIKHCNSEYIYIGTDGLIIDFNQLESILIKYKYKTCFSIDIEETSRIGHLGQDSDFNPDILYKYEDDITYIKKYYSHLTYWGAILFKKKEFLNKINDGTINKYNEDKISWWIPSIICEAINSNINEDNYYQFGVVYYSGIKSNPYKLGHSWSNGKKYYEIAIKVFNKDVDLLPKRYDGIKDDIIRFFRNDALLNKHFVLYQKLHGSVNLSYTLEYKNDIKRISGYYPYFLLISLMPNWLLNGLRAIKHIIKPKKVME